MKLFLRILVLTFLYFWLEVAVCSGQSSASFLDPSRALTSGWVAGFTIPAYSVNCATQPTLLTGSGNASANTTAIQNALATCDAAHNVVNIGAGTFYVAGITYPPQGKQVLRGAGANSTHLIITTTVGCTGLPAGICMNGATYYDGSSPVLPPSGVNQCSWTAGYSQGTTSITLNSCGSSTPASTGLVVGALLILDQSNDLTDNGGIYLCDSATSSQSGGGACSINDGGSSNHDGRIIGGYTYSQKQVVEITSVSGSGTGPYTVGLSAGVYFNNVRSGQSPGAWWAGNTVNEGLENLSIDGGTDSISPFNIEIAGCWDCWVKGVASTSAERAHVQTNLSYGTVIRDSYFYQSQSHASESYGYEPEQSSAELVENNIYQQITSPLITGNCSGCVVGYNLMIGGVYVNPNYLQSSYASHNAGNDMDLYEGNNILNVATDDTWGSSNTETYFRNFATGWQHQSSGPTYNTSPFIDRSFSRAHNLVGNVLGQPSYHTNYESYATSTTSGVNQSLVSVSIYSLGWDGVGETTAGTCTSPPQCDSVVRPTLMRWGNYDTVNAATQWNSTEAAPGAVAYVNANHSTGYFNTLAHTLPASLYYASTPSWWPSGKAWPPVGPDVTTGNVGICSGTYNGAQGTNSTQCTGGSLSSAWASHVVSIPAMDCYLSLGGFPDGSGSALGFSASGCYSTPPPGVSLTVSTIGSGSGTLGGTNCATGSYTSATSIICTATPAAGSVFSGWTGTGSAAGCTGTGGCSFSITATSTLSATFQGTAATPTFSSVVAGRVTISSTTPSTTIRYTVDGSTPTPSSAPYTHPLLISSSQTLKAIATAPGWVNSAVGSASYTIAKAKTRFSLTPTSAASPPVPYPPDLRACCGSNVAALNSALGTTNFTVLHNWINAAIANNSTFTYTIQGFPTWMTGLGANESAPPSDLHTVTTCAATGTNTTDCSMKSFVIALAKDRTGLSSQPASPVTCSHLDYLEIINEFNTDSPSGSSTGWTGSYSDLATLANDISTVTHSWCSNTIVVGGSASAIVGSHSNGENAHYDIALETLLADWAAIPSASLPDAISFHAYPARQTVIPIPFPPSTVNQGATCTSTSCYVAVAQEVDRLTTTATLQNPAIITWAKNLPIVSSEGGFGTVAQLGGTSTTVVGAGYVGQSMMGLAAQNHDNTPTTNAFLNHQFYAADDPTWGCYWNCGSGNSAWLFAYNQMLAWLTAHSITGTLTSSAITGGNKWSLQLDSGAAELDFCDAWLTNCSTTTAFTTQTTLAGVTSGTGGSIILTQEPTLLTNTAVANTPTFSPVGGSYGPAQSVSLASTTPSATICFTTDGSLPTANGAGTCTHGTTYSTAIFVGTSQTIKALASKSGLTDSVVNSSTYTINGASASPTFAPVAGTYTTAQAVAIATTTSGATLCFTLDGSTPTSSPAGTCSHGTTYASPVSVASNLTIKAIATESGFVDSSVASAAYVIAPVAGTPTFAPGTGTYGASQSVTISSTTSGATLCYTVDGSTPTANGSGTCTHGTTYTTPVSVASSLTLKAVASKSGNTDSSVGSAVYTINGSVGTPTFLPAAGTYTSTQAVAISSTTPGTVLCYTTDGSTPTANGSGVCTHGTTYSSPVSVASSLTLKAVGSLSGFTDSTVGSAAYVIAPLVATPTFSPVAGSYGPSQSVTISTVTSGAALCYTTDGTTPTANGAGTCMHGTTYSTAVTVSVSLTLKAVGSKSGNTDSAVASGTYTINGTAGTPTFLPVAGTYAAAQTVTISSTTTAATLCYTLDGSTPTADGAGSCTHGTTYSGPVLIASTLTLKAVASKAGFSDSTVGSAAYTILPPVTNVQVTGTGSIQGTGSVQ